jgi:hypothetical protein
VHPGEVHGERHTETQRRVCDFVLGDGEEERASFEEFVTALKARDGGRCPVDARGVPLRWRDGQWFERSPAEAKQLHEEFLKTERRERARIDSPSRDACGLRSPLTVKDTLSRLKASLAPDLAEAAAVARMARTLHARRETQLREERAVAERRKREAVECTRRPPRTPWRSWRCSKPVGL